MMMRRAMAAFVLLLAALSGYAQLNTTRVMEIGRNALYFEDYVLSIQYFNQVIDAKPFLHEPYFYRGLAKFYLDDFVGADEDLTVAIDKNPYVARSYQLRGLCRANMDSLVLAEKDLRTGIKYDPQNVNLWQNLAAVTMQQGRWEIAAGVIDSLLTFSPRYGAAYIMRTQVALSAGDTVKALAMADKAVGCDKYSANGYEARAMVYNAMGAYELAEADLDKAIELFPGRSGTYLNRAVTRYNRENLTGAMSDFDMAIYVDSTSLVAHYNRGLLRMEVGDNNRAIEDFNMVLGVDPDNTMARFNRGLLRSVVGDYKGAVSDYSKVIEAYPNFEYAYSRRAEARRKIGDRAGAKADESWLSKRHQEAMLGLNSSAKQDYSSDKDEARKRSEENVRNYNKMIVPDDANAKHYATEARGKVQNQNVYVELEPLYVLTYYSNDMVAGGTYYDKKLEELNASRTAESPLLLTNSERALAASEVSHHFGHIDELSRFITGAGDDAIVRRERAMDYYLVQDLEAAMADIDNAVLADSTSWSSYFMRAFIRYKLLETDQLNDTGNSNGFTLKHTSALPDIDYRLVKNDLDRVIEIYPGFAVAYYNRANVSAKLNDFKSAIVDYTKAIEIDSRFAAAYYNRGLAKIYLGNNEGGVADLSKAGELGMYRAYNVIKRFKNAVRR